MITYQLMIAESFPKWHSRAGEPTNFRAQLRKKKLHTFRGDYAKWRKRFDKIERGEACLSIRAWAGVPYRSDQRVICNFLPAIHYWDIQDKRIYGADKNLRQSYETY